MLWIGTSGFSYADWIGPFYPQGTRPAQMLELYARKFRTVEMNFTFYAMPGRRSIEGLIRKAPAPFRFAVKLHRSITHDLEPDGVARFLEALAPMRESGQLACVLAQFPFAFKNEERSRAYLGRLAQALAGVDAVVEFRHRSWAIAPVHALLGRLNLGLVCVDEPALSGLVPAQAAATSRVGYVRFHGRNVAKWFAHERPEERYDYMYSREELEGWLSSLRSIEERVDALYVYFNNHWSGQAPANATQLGQMIDPTQCPPGASGATDSAAHS